MFKILIVEDDRASKYSRHAQGSGDGVGDFYRYLRGRPCKPCLSSLFVDCKGKAKKACTGDHPSCRRADEIKVCVFARK